MVAPSRDVVGVMDRDGMKSWINSGPANFDQRFSPSFLRGLFRTDLEERIAAWTSLSGLVAVAMAPSFSKPGRKDLNDLASNSVGLRQSQIYRVEGRSPSQGSSASALRAPARPRETFPACERGGGFSTRGGAANPTKMFHDGASIRGRMIKPKH